MKNKKINKEKIVPHFYESDEEDHDSFEEAPESEPFDEDLDLEKEQPEEMLPALSKEIRSLEGLDRNDPLRIYLREVGRFKLLDPEEERKLTEELAETGDIEVAKKLVQANLRLVVKIAMEYRYAYQNILDLIQEGNIGLMKAVSKFNPDKGAKLSYYASWWIKSYILKFILDNFRLVKIGTTSEQKKLFYNLIKEKNRLDQLGIQDNQTKLISDRLGVSEKSVELMTKRLSAHGQEVSLTGSSSRNLDDSSSSPSILETLSSDDLPLDEALSHMEGLKILENNLGDFLEGLKKRDREIFTKRLLSEVPPSLQKLADDYGVSRERIRQIEERLIGSLKNHMKKYME